jgi:hypothetical protein
VPPYRWWTATTSELTCQPIWCVMRIAWVIRAKGSPRRVAALTPFAAMAAHKFGHSPKPSHKLGCTSSPRGAYPRKERRITG